MEINIHPYHPLVITEKQLGSDEIKSCRLSHLEFVTRDLVQKHPSKLTNPNKKIVYEIACSGSEHGGKLLFSRYRTIPVPKQIFTNASPHFEQHEDVFHYTPTQEPKTTEWYLNFADTYLFVAYSGPLFAQDEMQVAEMPALGSLKEALLAAREGTALPLTRKNDQASPILISGIERKCHVSVDPNPSQGRPNGLYGNAFSKASPDAIMKATKKIEPPTIINLIAMAALRGNGKYTQEQIEDTYTTAYTSFRAAKAESDPSHKIVIHTGNWGTGAFGGNMALMAIIQLAAAWQAGIDRLVYHTFNALGTKGYQQGLEMLNSKFSRFQDISEFLKQLHNEGFKWGVSDGN